MEQHSYATTEDDRQTVSESVLRSSSALPGTWMSRACQLGSRQNGHACWGTEKYEILGGAPGGDEKGEFWDCRRKEQEPLNTRTTRDHTHIHTRSHAHSHSQTYTVPWGYSLGVRDETPFPSPQILGEVGMTRLHTSREWVLRGFLGFSPALVVSRQRKLETGQLEGKDIAADWSSALGFDLIQK